MTSVIAVAEADQIATSVSNLTVQEHENLPGSGCDEMVSENHGTCAICLDKIALQDTALVKGCEHAYCAICILRWASYKENPTCPQCKHPFEFLNVHRSLDGSIKDYMFEESVCLLLRAAWFNPEIVEHNDDAYNELDEIYAYEDDDGDLDDDYYNNLPNLRIGNRRWGDNGYVRAGRQEARPVHRPKPEDSGASSSRAKKEPSKSVTGRRAKRALKREAADKAAADKHQQRLARFGR